MGYTSDFEIQCPFCQPFNPCFEIPLHFNKLIGFSNSSKYQGNFKVYFKDVFTRLQDA